MVSTEVKGKKSTSKGKPASKTKNAKSAPPPLKVVVRRLPHDMKEEQFLEAVTPAAAEAGMGGRGGSWDLIHFASGKMSKKRGRVTGTAYLRIDRGRGGVAADLSLMKLRAAIVASNEFVVAKPDKTTDKNGALTPVVEAAPFQKLFKQKPKRDARVGTIEKDPDYKSFCAALAKPTTMLPGADVQADIKESEGKEDPKPSNALLDFLKERGAKRMRDSQRAVVVGSSGGGSGSRRSGGTSTSSRSGGTGGGASGSRSSGGVASSSASMPTENSSTPSDTAPRAPVTDPGSKAAKPKGAEKEGRAGGGGKAGLRSNTPPPSSTQKLSGGSKSLSSAVAAAGNSSLVDGQSSKGLSSAGSSSSGHAKTTGSGRESSGGGGGSSTNNRGRAAAKASSSKNSGGSSSNSKSSSTTAVAKPSAILSKPKDNNATAGLVVSMMGASGGPTDSPRSSTGSGGGGGRGSSRSKGSGGGKGRSSGKSAGGGH